MSGADPTAAGSRFQGVDVLLVEDETIVSFLIEDMLTELGCTSVRHASGVSEALAILDGHRPDVAILDVNLAGEMGYAVAERLEVATRLEREYPGAFIDFVQSWLAPRART